MKHKWSKMIKAKADNMELVVLCKCVRDYAGDLWVEYISDDFPCFEEGYNYFLCLPQHKETCLHWLNDGKSQLLYTHQSHPAWNDIDNDATDWSKGHVFMDGSLNIRIKPKKVKRWIRVDENALALDTMMIFDCESDAKKPGCQVIEIEIEIEQ